MSRVHFSRNAATPAVPIPIILRVLINFLLDGEPGLEGFIISKIRILSENRDPLKQFLAMHSRSDSVAVFLYVFNICPPNTQCLKSESGSFEYPITHLINKGFKEHFSYPLSIPSSDLVPLRVWPPLTHPLSMHQ